MTKATVRAVRERQEFVVPLTDEDLKAAWERFIAHLAQLGFERSGAEWPAYGDVQGCHLSTFGDAHVIITTGGEVDGHEKPRKRKP